MNRVTEVLQGLANELRDFKSEASEKYIKTEEFEELLENVLRKIAEERNEDKRRLLRSFLVEEIEHPENLMTNRSPFSDCSTMSHQSTS